MRRLLRHPDVPLVGVLLVAIGLAYWPRLADRSAPEAVPTEPPTRQEQTTEEPKVDDAAPTGTQDANRNGKAVGWRPHGFAGNCRETAGRP